LDPEELDAFIDGEIGAARSAEISTHVAGCASCRLELERARKIDDAIRKAGPGASLGAMRSELVGRVRAIRRRSLLRVAVPAAAVIAAFVFGIYHASISGAYGRKPEPPPALASIPQIEALELDAASLRLALVAEKPEPKLRENLDARLDAIVSDIEKLRASARSNK
jgi:hypothetical protein